GLHRGCRACGRPRRLLRGQAHRLRVGDRRVGVRRRRARGRALARGELLSDGVTILLAALGVDVLLGEPPAWFHPVVWMGRMQGALRRRAPSRPLLAFLWGAFMAVIGPIVAGGLTWLVLARTHGLAHWIVAVFLLKSAVAVRALATAGWSVSRPLAAGNLGAARAALRGLVSRDTKQLSARLAAAAAVESIAENASD